MRTLLLLSFFIGLAACRPPDQGLQPAAEQAIENVTCPQSQSFLYDTLYRSLADLHQIPTEAELQETFQKALDAKSDLRIDHTQFLELVSEFYQILLSVPAEHEQDLLEKVTALEIGDQSTLATREAQQKLTAFEEKWKSFQAQQDVQCAAPSPATPSPTTPTPPVTPAPTTEPVVEKVPIPSKTLMVQGAHKVLVTAYQSCEAIRRDVMTSSTPSVQGISRVGTHPDGIGAKREITDLPALLRTDHYLQNYQVTSSCQDIRSKPPIYDYGGKPKTTSDENSPLDLLSDAGSGTSVRGIDCSAFVFSSLASSGLKLHPDKKLKAILVNGVSSTMFLNPADNGMPCLQKVKMGVSGTLKEGDIAAVSGHVVMIDSVGKDPFGLARAKTQSQCASLTADGFDFVIIQSSPSKKGIGINRYKSADYLQETTSMKNGFEAYAKQACTAKFHGKDVLMSTDNFQVDRHSQSATCRAQSIALVGESCAKNCSSL